MTNGLPGSGAPPEDLPRPKFLEILRAAYGLHRHGHLTEAEGLYLSVLKAAPDEPDALQLLGVLEAQRGRYESALGLFDRAIAVNPNDPRLHFNQGNALRDLGRSVEAVASYDRV